MWLAYVESRGVNDNVYGNSSGDVSYAGWTGTHRFNDLLTGDRLQIQLFDENSVKLFDVTLDYLFEQDFHHESSYNSGLLKFMPEGAEAEKYDGSPRYALGYNNVLEAETSQDYNQTCNNSKYNSRSPGPPEEGCWEYRTIYEVKISKAGLGLPEMITDTSRIKIPQVNNSPPKNATAISGFSYCDADHDGAPDPGENGLGGWTISLAGQVNDSTTTDANGFYEFFNIGTGSYTLTETAKPGYEPAQIPASFNLAAHQVARGKDFGNSPAGCREEASAPIQPVQADPAEEQDLNVEIVPNPFREWTDVRITSPATTKITVEIYDLRGSRVASLYDGGIDAGITGSFRFHSPACRSGQVFMCVIRLQQGNIVRKIVQIK